MEKTNFCDNEITLLAKVDELDRLLAFISNILEEAGLPARICSQLAVVGEELFVNIASYAYPDGGEGKARVRLRVEEARIVQQFEDSGVPFNPLEHEMPDVTAGIEERSIGGLGIYLARKWMDTIEYQRLEAKNVLTLYKAIK
jgi:anti-sigma regulatory factor (Ser/Thr protein kinase)